MAVRNATFLCCIFYVGRAGHVVASIPLVPEKLLFNGRYTGTIKDAGFEDCKALEPTNVTIQDLAAQEDFVPNLVDNGFELARLAPHVTLPELEDVAGIPAGVNYSVAVAGDERSVRPLARWVEQFSPSCTPLQMSSGSWVCIMHCAGEMVRMAGPDGHGMAGTPATFNAHVDQDRHGEPLLSMGIKGMLIRYAPYLYLVSIWMPLNNALVRPLAVFDAQRVRLDMLARLRTQTYELTSDRFLVTVNGTGHWWFDSSLARGHAVVMDAFKAPHTSFRHPSPNVEGVRQSMEMRCAAFIVPKVGPFAVGLLIVFVTMCALPLRGCLRRKFVARL